MKKELINVEYNDLGDMVFRMELTYSEIDYISNKKNIDASSTGYTGPPRIYEITDINLMFKSLLPHDVEVHIRIDDIRIKSNLNTNKSNRFTRRCFIYTTSGFIQSNSGLLGDIEGYIQLIPGKYKRNKPYNITGIDKFHLKDDCFKGSIVKGIREPILYSFGLSSPPSYRLNKELRYKLFKINLFCLK